MKEQNKTRIHNIFDSISGLLTPGWTVILFFVLIPKPELLAQACCSGGVPMGGTLGLGTTDAKSLQVLVTYDNNIINDLVDVRSLLQDETRSRQTRSAIIEVNYGLSEKWAIAAFIPYVTQERRILGFDFTEEFTSAQGLGDIIFLLKYNLINPEKNPKLQWVVGAGPKIPTGKTDFNNNSGLIMTADMQPGSGSLDGFFWTFFQKSRFLADPLSLVAVSTFRKSGTNRNYNEVQHYKFGDDFQFNLGLNYNFFAHWPIDVFVFGRYRNQTVDIIDGNTFPSSGGEWVYVIPGFNINLAQNMAFRASIDLPVHRNLLGTQLTTSYRYTMAMFFNIPFKKNNEFLKTKFGDL